MEITISKLLKGIMYRANAYLRLSKEDGDKAESDSIANQRELILSYLSDKTEIQLIEERVDDGYSGATFDRPSFQKMLQDIKSGKINCIIVKDLSRFGRNFVEAGRYIDQIFPEYSIRFISINDNFDSARGRSSSDNVLLPFLNLINDAFCRDISIKVRSQLEIKRKKGDFIGSFAVFGYLKDPKNRHKLIVDTYAAAVVRDIYKWKIDGVSQQRIADKLNERGILSPMEYKRYCGMAYRSGFQVNPNSKWTPVAIGRILRNEYYLGTLVQGKRTTPNHKVKKIIEKPSEEWVRIEHNHEPIVTVEEFSIVKRLLLQDMRVAPEKETVSLLSGLIFCGDCGQSMVKNNVCKHGKTYSYYMCCQNRTTKGCSSHRIPEQAVIDAVLYSIKQQIIILQFDNLVKQPEQLPLQNADTQKTEALLLQKQKEIKRYQALKVKLYETLNDGLIDEQEYIELKSLYEGNMLEAQASEHKLMQELESILQNQTNPKAEWIQKFMQAQTIDKLDRRIAVMLLNKILVFKDCRLEILFQYQDGYEQSENSPIIAPPSIAPLKKEVG